MNLVITQVIDNRIAKYLQFDDQQEAIDKAQELNAIFYDNSANNFYKHLFIDEGVVTVKPLEVVKPVITVSSNQFIRALIQLDLYDEIDAAVDASNDKETQALWRRASSFSSNDKLVLSVGATINKSVDEIYQIFELADTL